MAFSDTLSPLRKHVETSLTSIKSLTAFYLYVLGMSNPSKETSELYEELKWVSLGEENVDFVKKLKSKGLLGVLVPLGCITTAGILLKGVHFMFKRDSVKQQQFMRYRVVAQAITIALTTVGILNLKI